MSYMGERVHIRFIRANDAEALLDLMQNNRALFEQVVPKRNESFYTLEQQEKIIDQWTKSRDEDKRYAFGIFLNETNQLIGEVSFFEVRRGALQNCILGYCLDQKHNGKGYMTEAIDLILNFAFKEAGLHRVEAGVLPSNQGSIRVLEKAGFKKEGLAKKLLEINGKREDHLMFAILDEDFFSAK
ncbi:GNAT family N-acetyltransferase [Paenibacillus aceris]|uniref:Ribosomal-protein-alanine N-acetyltransferase n=1 Tax=Paenibacillus aceris TaxID=869555 RepID=A0ABS4HVR4_9BACL|nr:GNAT family protein [Paenibacillus aceris]MBP1962640.1 ribosomal-protein-alanine N-acetyltransferase [Paenibacillus aceris]NHW37448.1 GNAT family N-acetyltransferase [Paenibacillus aceris]